MIQNFIHFTVINIILNYIRVVHRCDVVMSLISCGIHAFYCNIVYYYIKTNQTYYIDYSFVKVPHEYARIKKLRYEINIKSFFLYRLNNNMVSVGI